MIYTVVDVETSGLSTDSDDVLSFSYALTDGHEIFAADTLYFWNDSMKWSEESYKIHKLSKEFLSQFEDDFQKNIRAMYTIVQGSILTGYNSGYKDSSNVLHGFDFKIIQSFLRRHMIDTPTPYAFMDLLRIVRKDISGLSNRKLQTVVDYLGISRSKIDYVTKIVFSGEKAQAHNSGYDVVCTAYVLKELLARDLVEVKTADRPVVSTDFEFMIIDGNFIAIYDDKVMYSFKEFVDKFPVIYTQIFGGIF